ncbi:unnamed protein product [Ectocarpus sp. 6 AP-2014]
MAASIDSPAWTFGLNPTVPGPRVPGPGTYNVAGSLDGGSAGTFFSPIGAKPTCPRTDVKRLVFGIEREGRDKPGPGAYDVTKNRPLRWNVSPRDRKHQTPRFPVSSPATDAGPGAYISSEFAGKGPAYSMPSRSPTTLDKPDSPGPGQYVHVQLSVGRGENGAGEGFGKRDSPRFATEATPTPGPGEYQSPAFNPQLGKNITFGRNLRPAGWSARIKEITRFACELDGGGGGDDDDCDGDQQWSGGWRRVGRFRAPLHHHRRESAERETIIARLRRRPSSAPPSSRFRRACARGRRLDRTADGGGGDRTGKKQQRGGTANGSSSSSTCRRPRFIADVVKEAGRRKRAKSAAAMSAKITGAGASPSKRRSRETATGRGASMGTAPQRPPDAAPSPGPSSYRPATLDETARDGKVVGIGGRSKRELFPPSPDTPGPEQDSALRPGVGDYDLRAAEAAAAGSSTAVSPTLGRKPTGAPYDPALSRYLFRDDGRVTPSAHAYRPESARGGGGDSGLAGQAAAPPAWSFGGKRPTPRPPDGPGPGKFRPPYNNETDPCCSSSPAGVRFGAGREDMSGSVSGVPWVEAEERAARGEAGGRSARLYLPERDRMGSRAFMRSRQLPRPGTRGPR